MIRKMAMNKIQTVSKLIIFFCSVTLFTNASLADEPNIETEKTATIQALNKITAKTSLLNIKIGDKVDFGQISIIAHKCWKAPLDQKPESKLLLEVIENNEDLEKRIFYGWIFASSPSISGLEHPIYDLTALDCVYSETQ